MLGGFLDWHRAVVEHKLQGLELPEASQRLTSTGLSVLGVVKHLALCEEYWFEMIFAGTTPLPAQDPDPSASADSS